MILFSDGALTDLERIFAFNVNVTVEWASRQLVTIQQALSILAESPLIGRRVTDSGLRELVISSGKDGFVALYHFDAVERVVRVAAVRHQREAGYRDR